MFAVGADQGYKAVKCIGAVNIGIQVRRSTGDRLWLNQRSSQNTGIDKS